MSRLNRETRRALAAAAVLLIATFAAACGGGGKPASNAQGNNAGSQGSQAPIKIGFFAPESGFAAADGQSAQDAAKLAVDEINRSGGIQGRPVRLVDYDDGSDAKQAVAIANKLINLDHVTAVVSGSYSDQTLAAAPIFQRNHVPMIAAYAVNPGIPNTGSYIFQQSFTGTVEGRAGAVLAVSQLGGKKIAVVAIDNDFGHSLVEGFTQEAKQLGASIVATDYNQFGEKEFTPIIQRDLAKGADLFYLVEYGPEGSQFIREWNALGVKKPLVGTEGVDSTTEFLQVVGKQADGMVITTNLDRDSQNPEVQRFVKDFTARFGHPPDMVAASTYDAFFVLAHAMRSTGLSPEEIQKGLASIRDFDAITGKILRYTSNREVVKPVQLQVVKNGEFHHYGIVDDPALIQP
ncbi:MAG: ABC transporter substrate-binding protein [Bacillota bacterium]|nr:ABC transporter substrate-binding protein [Bacillota bacterium]